MAGSYHIKGNGDVYNNTWDKHGRRVQVLISLAEPPPDTQECLQTDEEEVPPEE